jgi:hypothetical protein
VEARAAAFTDCRSPFGSSAKADSLRVNEQLVQSGLEFALGKQLDSAQALVEFEGGQAALAIEFAKKIVRGALALLGIAFQAGGDEVAIGIRAEAHARHNVVNTLHSGRQHA